MRAGISPREGRVESHGAVQSANQAWVTKAGFEAQINVGLPFVLDDWPQRKNESLVRGRTQLVKVALVLLNSLPIGRSIRKLIQMIHQISC